MSEPTQAQEPPRSSVGWLNRTVLGIGLASLFSDWSHEIATTVMPAFLATMGVAAAWLGVIEGVSDGLSSFTKMASGYYTDRLRRRKPIAIAGYLVTALGTASFGLATSAWHVLAGRAFAWLGRGVRTPVRKALLAASVTRETYGRAFGFERMMDTVGAIIGPATAFVLLQVFHHHYPTLFAVTLIPSLLAAGLIAFVVKENITRPCVACVAARAAGAVAVRIPQAAGRGRVVRPGRIRPHLADFAGHAEIDADAGRRRSRQRRRRALRASQHLLRLVRVHRRLAWRPDAQKPAAGGGYFMSAAMSLCVMFLPATLGTLALVFILGGNERGPRRNPGGCAVRGTGVRRASRRRLWHAGDGERRRGFAVERRGGGAMDRVRHARGIRLQRGVVRRGGGAGLDNPPCPGQLILKSG